MEGYRFADPTGEVIRLWLLVTGGHWRLSSPHQRRQIWGVVHILYK